MKKNLSCLLILFLGLTILSCSNELELPKITTSELTLLVPQNDSDVNLQNRSVVTFAWENSSIVTNYNLLLSTKEDLSDAIVIATNANPYVIKSSQMNSLAKSLGIGTGSSKKVYWTIQSGKSSQPSTAEVKYFTLQMLMAQPLTPENDSVISLDYTALSSGINFSWESMSDYTSYQLIVSTNADLSNPFINTTVNGTSSEVTQQQFQNVIENPAYALKRYKGNTIYWNVKAGDKFLSGSVWKFKLYGTKIFTDIRGTETITYKVAVIPSADGSEEYVWMAENLRTKKLNNGVDLVYDVNGQKSWNSQYFTPQEALINASTPVPDELRANAGMYYRVQMIGDNSSSVVWPSLIAPAKWRVPETQDFLNLTNATLKDCNYLEVLRASVAYPSLLSGSRQLDATKMNLWGMNMSSSGINRVASPGSLYVSEFAVVNGPYMSYAINSISQSVILEIAGSTGKGNARAIALGYNAPIVVRLIYKGDD